MINQPMDYCAMCDNELPAPDEPDTCYYTGRGPCGGCDKQCFDTGEKLCVDCRHVEHDWRVCVCSDCADERQLQRGKQVYGEEMDTL